MAVNKLDLEKAVRLAERLRGQYADFWVPEQGQNLIRILPPIDSDSFVAEIRVHFIPGEFPVTCLGEECPICEESARLFSSEVDEDVELGKKLAAKTRYFMYVLNLKDPDSGPKVFSCSRRVLSNIMAFIADPEWGDITDLEKGYDIVLERAGTGVQTTYSVRTKKQPSKAPITSDRLNELPALDKVLPKLSKDEAKAKLAASVNKVAFPISKDVLDETAVPTHISELADLVGGKKK